MKKVVHIIQSLEKGGAEKFIVNMARAMAQDYKLTVICQYERADAKFLSLLQEAQIDVVFLHKKKGFSLHAFAELWRALSSIKPDIVHTHLQAAAYAVPWYLFHPRRRKLHTIHSVPHEEFTRAHMLMQWFAYHFLGVIPVAITDQVRAETAKLYHIRETRIPLIYNGIDTLMFSVPHITGDDIFRILNVANFSPWKSQGVLIEALRCLPRGLYHVSFAGEGALRLAVMQHAAEAELEDETTFLGSVDNIPAALQTADVFVLCSSFEGLPLSVLEAYAAGLPVVCTAVGGLPDVITDGENGFLVPVNDPAALADALARLRGDRALYKKMSENNRKKAQQFDSSHVAEKYMRLYEKGRVEGLGL